MSKIPDSQDREIFRAEIRPYCSLSSRGVCLVLGFVCCVSLGVTTLFWWLGAWPVAGFNGAEIALTVLLLRLHRRANRRVELLLLTERRLIVRTTDVEGRHMEASLPNLWLTVVLEERPGRVPGLLLCSRGQCLDVAAALGEAEKRDLAAALERALHRQRNPVFDNPQLRAGAGSEEAPA